MYAKILTASVMVLWVACSQDEPGVPQQKSFGGQLGDSYKGMLDDAKLGVEHANEQMNRTEQAVRERD